MDVIKGFKAYNKGLKCRGFQFEEGKIYEEKSAEICKKGFHFCKNPLDTLDYYDLIDNNGDLSDFTEIEALDEVKTDDDKKFCTRKIKIGAKLDLKGFIKASIDFLFEKNKFDDKTASSGYNSKLASSGDYSKLASSGYNSKLASSGYYSQLASSGYNSKLASSGYYSQLASSGYNSKLASSGDYSKLASSGYNSKLASSGYYSQLASSGDYSKLASSGYNSKLASSGDYSQLASSGYNSQLASSGYNSQLASSGDYSQLASSGDYSKLASSGYNSVIANIGIGGAAKGIVGNWITLAEYKYDNNKNCYIPVCVKSAQIDGKILKEDTFYKLENGEFKEV